MEDDDPHQPQAPWSPRSRSRCHVICLSRVGPVAHKWKTNSRSITKIGRRVPHDTCYIAHQSQGQKVEDQAHRLTNADTQNVPYSRTVTPKNFKVRVRMEDVDLIQRQAPWPQRLKVKITRSHGISDLCGSYYKICTWYSDKVSRRILPTIAVTSKVKGQDLKFASSVRLVSASS